MNVTKEVALEKPDSSKNKYPPNLYKVGENSWMVDFAFRGERYRENLGPVSRTVAREKVANRKAGVAAGDLLVSGKRWNGRRWIIAEEEPEIEDPVFDEACDKYLDWYKEHSRASSYDRHWTSAISLKAKFGGKRLSEISAFGIEEYKLDRKKQCSCVGGAKRREGSDRCSECGTRLRGKAEATINKELAMLKHLFRKCIEWGLAKSNPVQQVKLFREGQGRTRYLSEEEAQRLLDSCNPDFRVVVLTAMHTGCRKSELTSLRWSRVDMVNRSITVDSCYSKNGETRTIPMTNDVFETFKMRQDRDRTPEDLVFVSRYGKPWRSWRTAFRNAVERAGLHDFRFHDLRHCYGSWLAMSGTIDKGRMELMGHKTPSMSMRYAHLSMDYKRAAVAKLPSFGNLPVKSPQNPPSAKTPRVVGFAK